MLFSKHLPGLRLILWMTALATVLPAGSALGQVTAAGTRPPRELWAGAEYSNINASFPYQSNQTLWGIGGFVDYHRTTHIDFEGEVRFLRFNSNFPNLYEDNYLAGPRYIVERFHKFQPYAQVLFGINKIQYPYTIGSGRYFALAGGGGVNYRFAPKWTIRGEYEYQYWVNSPNITIIPPQTEHTLTPYGYHIGLAYRVH